MQSLPVLKQLMLNKVASLLQPSWSFSFYWLKDDLSKTWAYNERGNDFVNDIAKFLLNATILPG